MKETYEITVKRSFSAAHVLREIGGKCESLHGHNFIVEVTVQGNRLDNKDLLMDFRDLKRWTEEILASLDHTHLNELPYFQGINPSAERIARYIHHALMIKIPGPNVRVKGVTVWESDHARVTYTAEHDG